MRTALRTWLVLGAACGLVGTTAACAQSPQVSKTSPSAVAHASGTPSVSPSVGTLKGGWNAAGELSTKRGGQMAGALLKGGRVLVTGTSWDGLGVGNVDIYDPAGGWSTGAKLSSDRVGAAASALVDGRFLLAGGNPFFQGDSLPPGPLATAVIYNPTRGTWTNAPSMNSGRSDATATTLPDGRVLIAGGYDRRVTNLTKPPYHIVQVLPLASSQLFLPTSSTWTPGPAMAQGRFGHLAVALRDGRVLVVGGADQQDPLRLLNTAELFDPAAGRWVGAGTIGAPRTQFTLTALADGRALLAGGLAADGSTVLASTLLYDPGKNLWSPGPELASVRTGHAAAPLADGKVLVTGGADQLGRLASSELFDPVANSWSATGALTTSRSDHLAITLASGRVLVFGGRGSGDPLATAELFDPSAPGSPAPARTSTGPGRWQLAAASSSAAEAYSDSVQLLPDGRVVLIRRRDSADFQVYDPVSNAWTTAFSRKPPPCNACGIGSPSPPAFLAGPMANSKILLLTIDPQRVIAAKAEVVDLNTGTATTVASPGKIGWSRLDLLPDGRIWLTALRDVNRHALVYDPIKNRWAATSDVPVDLVANGSDMQSFTPIAGGRVLVGGSLKAMIYDPASGSWAEAGSFPSSAGASLALGLPSWTGFSATALRSGDVLLAGGSVLTGTTSGGAPIYTTTSQTMLWDHASGMLASAQKMPAALGSHSAALLADGRVLMAGGVEAIGFNGYADPVARAETYDPATRTWSTAAPLPVARFGALAVTLADGRVLLVGGQGMFGPPASLLFSL